MYDKPRNPHSPGLHLSQKYSLEMVAAAWLKCFLQGPWTAGTAGPQPSGLESLCRRLCSHLPPPGLGTEVGSRQGKQADNQVGPELRREKERIGGGRGRKVRQSPERLRWSSRKRDGGFCLCVCASISSFLSFHQRKWKDVCLFRRTSTHVHVLVHVT